FRGSPLPRPQRRTIFPYTTLFRSQADGDGLDALGAADQQRLQALLLPVLAPAPVLALDSLSWVTPKGKTDLQIRAEFRPVDDARSEEHTSELQSRENLVCRLLLEK